MFHPSVLMFGFFLFISILMVFSSTSWLMIWIALEINLLSFIPILMVKKSKNYVETPIKYFLIQAMASVVIVTTIIIDNDWFDPILMISMSVLLKMGAAPLHQWMPSLAEGLSWMTTFILLTLQKINPLIILASTSPFLNPKILMFFATTSAVVGAWGGLNQTSLRKLMIFSAISHSGWLISALLMSSNLCFTYFLIYSSILGSILLSLKTMDVLTINQMMLKSSTPKLILALSLMSLSGLPPFSGFAVKLMVLQDLQKISYWLMMILIFSSLTSLYFYMRVFFNLIQPHNKTNFIGPDYHGHNKLLILNMFVLAVPSLALSFLLNFKL